MKSGNKDSQHTVKSYWITVVLGSLKRKSTSGGRSLKDKIT